MKLTRFLFASALAATSLYGQAGLPAAKLLEKAPTDMWPTYNGDYSGRRFSPLTKINDKNVHQMSLAWIYRAPVFAGGGLKSTPLMINGVLYFTVVDHVYAVDARTGRELWHFTWNSAGGIHLGNRGVAAYGNWLYFETPDCHLVSLNMKDGTERWRKQICDLEQFYYGSIAPLVVKNHILAGVSGDDIDIPGYVQAHDPETGDVQWRFYTVPMKKGDPGFETWPNEDMASHGGGMTWQPYTYAPELNLVYVTTGNPQPVIAHKNRPGDNLYTGSIVALDADTGKMAWHFQSSPHDTHDWDSTQTAVLIDGTIAGRPRKLIAQAARNGHFFVLDRITGKALSSTEFVKTNWTLGYDAKGQPVPNPAKHPQLDGALVSPNQSGAANWHPPAFSPATGLFYVNASRAFSVYYIYDPDDNPQGWGGNDRGGYDEGALTAIDYKTGKVKWTHKWEASIKTGILTTAGNLVFAGGPAGAFVALNATTGQALWQTRFPANISNGPITWEMDGIQYLTVFAVDTVYTFAMMPPVSAN